MQQVKHLLAAKGNAVYAVAPDASVYEALQQMADKNMTKVSQYIVMVEKPSPSAPTAQAAG